MYHLILLALIGAACAVPAVPTNQIARNDALAAAYVLPTTTYPTFYDVRLFIDPGFVDYFFGNVSIRILANEATNEIVLQAMEMEIQNIRVHSDSNEDVDLFESFTLAQDDTHLLRIRLSEALPTLTPHIVHIDYVGQYASDMFGLYVSTYEGENGGTVNLVTSQLQPTFGRRTFPCYDEPASKAVFRTTIYAPPSYGVVRSNMPNRAVNLKEEVAGWTKHEFEDTLVMSTYLLAYVVCNFDFVDNTANALYHIPFRVYSRPDKDLEGYETAAGSHTGKCHNAKIVHRCTRGCLQGSGLEITRLGININGTQDTASFALDFGQRNMVALEEYTNFPYLFPKLDKVAVPDFGAGAMENWGLVIYREVALLVQEGVTTTATLQNIGRIISHENTHQWFGNEVGPQSWTYTWLNEGFANFFEAYATDLVLPEWRMMDQYVPGTMQGVFQSDAVLTVNPMTHAVYTPSEIISTFNSVAYQKSGSVIRMMQHFLTPEVFRQGLIYYIQNLSRRAAEPSDLYAALQQALDESNHTIPYPLTTIMDLWTNQGGFPVLTVRRTAQGSNSIQIDQERFLTDSSLTSSNRWYVPVNWVLSTNPDFTDTSPQGWVPIWYPAQSYDIPGLNNADWYLINKQQTGYYRVNYEDSNWAALANVINSSPQTIHLLNRAQLIDDSFNLARNGRLSYNYPLDISRYLIQESDYIPWASANSALVFLDNVLSGSQAHELFSKYVLNITAPLYQTLGFTASATEEHVTPFHRTIILNFNCRSGNDDCVNTASQILEDLRNNPNQVIDPDIQTTVFCSGLRGGDVDNFNFLWNRLLASQDSSEQSILMNALGCTSNAEMRDFYLSQVTSDNSAVREQDRHTILVSTINAGPENMEVAYDFVIENFLEIKPRVNSFSGTTNILNALANRLTTQEHLAKIEQFAARYDGSFTAGELASIAFTRENIAAAITWNSVNYNQVNSWLNSNFAEEEPEDSGANIVASVALIMSVAVAILNLV